MFTGRWFGGMRLTSCAVDQDAALGRGLEPGQHPQQRGLAAARGAQQGEELALLDGQVETSSTARVSPKIFTSWSILIWASAEGSRQGLLSRTEACHGAGYLRLDIKVLGQALGLAPPASALLMPALDLRPEPVFQAYSISLGRNRDREQLRLDVGRREDTRIAGDFRWWAATAGDASSGNSRWPRKGNGRTSPSTASGRMPAPKTTSCWSCWAGRSWRSTRWDRAATARPGCCGPRT